MKKKITLEIAKGIMSEYWTIHDLAQRYERNEISLDDYREEVLKVINASPYTLEDEKSSFCKFIKDQFDAAKNGETFRITTSSRSILLSFFLEGDEPGFDYDDDALNFVQGLLD